MPHAELCSLGRPAPPNPQVQGAGDCLFHSIAIGMAFEDEQCHLDMYDPSLKERVRSLRALAVKTLTDDPNRTLHLEGSQATLNPAKS